ncbi:MAG TPA: hypothetical protein VFC41_05240 [Anaerovoracaceae bacterium]|nr:hypothetical protein [Anaerovoracaceae bacterium]
MNTHYSSNNQFKSINYILDVFSSDIFESVTLVMRPVIGTVDYLRSMHRLYQIQKELDQILKMDFETREKLLEALTDIISIDIYENNLGTIENKLEDQIAILQDFNESFKKLKSFSKNLGPLQQTELFRITLRKLSGRISSIREEIKFKIWDKAENTNQLLVLNQYFFNIQELIKKSLKKVDDVDIWILINVSLLRIEAFHRGKISFQDLQGDITNLSLSNFNCELIPRNYNAVFEVLEA